MESILGIDKIYISNEERINIKYARKSYYYKDNFKTGTKITLKLIKLLRPRSFVNPGSEKVFKNKFLKRNVKKNEPVKIRDFK